MKKYKTFKEPRLDSIFGLFEWNPLDTLMQMWSTNKNVKAVKDTNTTNLQSVRETNAMNERMIRETNAQNLQLQHEAWRREDTAVQRRMADLSAGGINPLLAAGGAAQASGPISLNAPQHQAPRAQPADRYAVRAAQTDIIERMLRMRDDFATSLEQRKLLRATADEHSARADEIRRSTTEGVESWDVRMEQLAENLRMSGERITLLELQQENQRLRNTGQVNDNIISAVNAEYARLEKKGEISEMMERIIKLEVENRIMSRDADMREEAGIPSTGSIPEKGLFFIHNVLNHVVDSVVEWSNRRGEERAERATRNAPQESRRRRIDYQFDQPRVGANRIW